MSRTDTSKPIYILDTNIWLDWLVFTNDTIDSLKQAKDAGAFEIIYTPEMMDELADVIAREQFNLSIEQQENVLASMCKLAYVVEEISPLVTMKCKDKDDQMFIDAALAYRANWLLSKDKHLLRLKSRALKGNVHIGTVDDWRHKIRT